MSQSEGTAFSMEQFRWKHRPLLIFAPSPDDERYRDQIEKFQGRSREIEDREMVLLHIFEQDGNGEETQALRDRYGVRNGEFLVVLVGKDGGTKLDASEPLNPAEVFDLIDAMPMRRKEIQNRRTF